ncbi:MAG: glycosyltransferase family 39 protein [Flavisolibacter sp.]
MRKGAVLLPVFVAIKFILQYVAVHPVYELHRDEFLHIDQGKHLAWGYLSVPPVTSWFSFVIVKAGSPEWLVRFFPALFGALTILVAWRLVAAVGGGLFAQSLAAIALIFSVLLRLNVLFQPNSLDVLMWLLLMYFLVQYTRTQQPKWIYGAAFAFGIGFLNKYNIGFLAAGLLPALLLSPQRRWFTKKHFYFAAIIALLIILPNIIWQVQNGFPVVHHMKELAATQLENFDRWHFVQENMLFFLGSIYVIVAALVGIWTYAPFRPYRFLFFTFFFTLLLFLYFKAKPYYAIGLYPAYLAFGAAYLENIFNEGWKKYLRPALLIVPAAAFLPFLTVIMPARSPEAILANPELYQKTGMLYWEDGKEHPLPQDFADMVGWKELAAIVDSAYDKLDDPQHTLVLCDNYGEAGAVNFYSRHKNINAVSMNADYLGWFNFSQPIRNVVLVKDPFDDDAGRQREKPFFTTVRKAGTLTNPFSREKHATVFLLQDARIDLNKFLKKEIEQRNKAMKLD